VPIVSFWLKVIQESARLWST